MVSVKKRKLWITVGIAVAVVLLLSVVAFVIYRNVLRTDDIKRDKWRLDGLNKRIDAYIKGGNPIETSENLLMALTKEGSDIREDLCPDSVDWGYHFWYDTVEQEVILATYGELSEKTDGDFEKNSPRSLYGGFYLLDMANSEENRIGYFFELLGTMKTADDYKAAMELLNFANSNVNKTLATAMIKRMEATAVVNENGIFTNTDHGAKIKNIYMPESVLFGEYTATGMPHHLRGEVNLSVANVGTVKIPENVKIGEFCFEAFGEKLTLYVNTDDVRELGEILSVDSCLGQIRIATGEIFRIEKNVLKDESGQIVHVEKDGVTEAIVLGYRKPVTDFAIGCAEALSMGEGAVYIDQGKKGESDSNGVLYAAYNLDSFTLNANSFNENISSDVVIWEEIEDVNSLISVDQQTGKVTVERVPEIGDRENYTATVKATAKAGGYSETIEIYIVRPISLRLNLATKVLDLADGESGALTLDYKNSNQAKTFSIEKINYNTEGMVVCDVSTLYTCETPNDEWFGLSASGVVDIRKVPEQDQLVRFVSVKVGCLLVGCEITVRDISNLPIEVQLENNNYIYKVGNVNPLTLGHFFRLAEGKSITIETLNADVFSVDGESILGGEKFGAEIIIPEGESITPENWQDVEVRFNGTGICDVEIFISEDVGVGITLEIVDGTNITEWVTGNASCNLVLQSDVTVPAKDYMLYMGSHTLYGNCFIIDAKSVTKNHPVDDPSTKKDEGSTSEDVIYLSGGGLDGVILLGNTFEAVHNSSDEKNPYWVHGVNVKKKATITNSYLYGFRAPMRVDSGTLTMSDTVLDGGCFANMYVTAATALHFHNVTTIQSEYGNSGIIGCGLLFANYGGSPELTVTGEFHQYNYVTKKQLNKVGGAKYGALISTKLSRMDQFKHSNYFHVGVLVLSQGQKTSEGIVYKNMPNVQHNLSAWGYTSDVDTHEFLIYVKAQLISLDNASCGNCTPKLKPTDLTGDGKYDHNDFIYRLSSAIS